MAFLEFRDVKCPRSAPLGGTEADVDSVAWAVRIFAYWALCDSVGVRCICPKV